MKSEGSVISGWNLLLVYLVPLALSSTVEMLSSLIKDKAHTPVIWSCRQTASFLVEETHGGSKNK